MNANDMRTKLLEVVQEYNKKGSGYFQQGAILRETAKRLDIRNNIDLEQILLTQWSELFRIGYLAWGYDIANSSPPFCHITEKATETLKNFSRDPANKIGYISYIEKNCSLNDVSKSYIMEGLETFNNNCYKAAAVMIGCASESVILELRDKLVTKMKSLGKSTPSKLNDWRIKTVIDMLTSELNNCKGNFHHKLKEQYTAYWTSLSGQIRISRNDAGHPVSVEPVTFDTVYASLLIFPELVKLIYDIIEWINTSYC